MHLTNSDDMDIIQSRFGENYAGILNIDSNIQISRVYITKPRLNYVHAIKIRKVHS